MFRISRLFAVFLLLAVAASAQLKLSTASNHNNGDHGVMFDVRATADMRLTGVELYLSAGPHAIEMYRVTGGGSFIGFESDASAWTLVDTVIVVSAGEGAPTYLPSDFEVNIPVGATQGLYFRSVTGLVVRYRNGSNAGGIHLSNSHLELLEGVGKNGYFGSTNGTTTPGGPSRIFSGSFYYALGLAGVDSAATTFAVPNDSEDSMTFDIEAGINDVVVTGLSVNLIGGTHDLDLWVADTNVPNQVAGQNFNNWRKIGSVTGFASSGGGTKIRLPMDFEAIVPAGVRRGFYLTSSLNDAINGEQKSSDGSSAALGDDIKVFNGTSYMQDFGPFLGTHMIDADIHYRVPTQSSGILSGGTGLLQTGVASINIENGVFFDLKSSEPIVVEGLTCDLQPGTHTIEVWAVTSGQSHLGNDADQALWTRISSEIVIAPTQGLIQVASDLRLFIPAAGVQGVYITGTGSPSNPIIFEQSAGPVDVATDGIATVTRGSAGDYPFIPQLSNVRPNVEVNYRRLGRAENGFFEDFSSASLIDPPTGWISSFVDGNREKLDGWRFDNPGGRSLGDPLSAPVAICDSDESGTFNQIDASLISPSFDASIGSVNLTFNHYFQQHLTSLGTVDVWNGSVWTNVASYNATNTNAEGESLDITAACGGFSEAMIRFRYTGNFDWYWILDDVNVQIGQAGQRPQLGIGEFDINFSTDAIHNQPVSSGLPGPYVATANTFAPTIFSWDGEPNQPLRLFAGFLNLGNEVLTPGGQLDVGTYDAGTNTFPGITLIGDGTAPDLINAAFRTSNAGRLIMEYVMPVFTVGQTFHFQSAIFSSTVNIALTNVVSLTVN